MTSNFEAASSHAQRLIRASRSEGVKIKRFKITRKQATAFVDDLANDLPSLFSGGHSRAKLLDTVLAGESNFHGIPVAVIPERQEGACYCDLPDRACHLAGHWS